MKSIYILKSMKIGVSITTIFNLFTNWRYCHLIHSIPIYNYIFPWSKRVFPYLLNCQCFMPIKLPVFPYLLNCRCACVHVHTQMQRDKQIMERIYTKANGLFSWHGSKNLWWGVYAMHPANRRVRRLLHRGRLIKPINILRLIGIMFFFTAWKESYKFEKGES